MTKLFSLFVLVSIYFLNSSAQSNPISSYFESGMVLEQLSMKSSLLKSDVNYAIYLPPDYNKSNRSYPVVYLLHGYSDNETTWIQLGEVNAAADRAIASREIPPMIIVMPDAKISWYINDAAGKDRYEDMFFSEFIPFIDKTYRTRASKEFRAVSGLSMGGFGSLVWSLHHPDAFVACAAFSAGIFTDEEIEKMDEKTYSMYFADIYGADKKTGRLTEYWKHNSILDLMNSMPVKEIEKVKFYIDCGDDDFLYRGNSELHMLMRDRNIYHEYRVKNGEHNWDYWRQNITEGLIFIGDYFTR